jgi:uncharacterized repeat protein (TIGR03803 family)
MANKMSCNGLNLFGLCRIPQVSSTSLDALPVRDPSFGSLFAARLQHFKLSRRTSMNSIRQQARTFSMAAVALTMLAALFTGTVRPAQSQTFTTLYSFKGVNNTPRDGNIPNGLVQGTNGLLYGTTAGGGGSEAVGGGGTIFKFSPSGAETVLYSFGLLAGDADGEAPQAPPVPATNGNFYGTSVGNSGGCGGGNGTCGVAYKITPGGALTIIYDFCSVGVGQSFCLDGTTTEGALVLASNGDLYGTNQVYGTYGNGTLFKITPGGALTTLHSFCAIIQNDYCTDGEPPYSALVQGTDGKLYGTTTYGGTINAGTIFSITQGGTFTTLHSFGTDGDLGALPKAPLVQGADGNFYGTTAGGGSTGYGSFFTMTPSGTVTTLYSFCPTGFCTDGADPLALVLGTDGNFYGLTSAGGANNVGTIFQITPSGTLTTVHTFDLTDGYGGGAIMQATSGKFYGTTVLGGANYQSCSCGTVFSLSMGLGPFVETLPASGKVGASIKILGTNLKAATSVSFNGTAATFKVVSNSEITTTVPAGATTGEVQVATPKGTLKSNVAFRVP